MIERLGGRPGITPEQVYTNLSLEDIYGWMAYDKTNDSGWLTQYNEELELQRQADMNPAELLALQKQQLKRAEPKNDLNRKFRNKN